MTRGRGVAWVALAVVCLWPLAGFAGKFNRMLSVGDVAPSFADLPGVDDKLHGLAEYLQAKCTVVVFICNHCPVAQSYEERLIALQKEFAERGVKFVAINCNDFEADRLPAMKDRHRTRGFNFPYLYDASQETGRTYGASVTPEAFVLQPNGTVAYMGAIDDNWESASDAERHYLRAAIEAVLAGKQPEVTETKAPGCGIHYE